jgi:protein translocase SecG subunit
MIKIISNVCSVILIIFTLARLPEKSGGSIDVGPSILGSPKKTSQTLETMMWWLTGLFFILSSLNAIQTR